MTATDLPGEAVEPPTAPTRPSLARSTNVQVVGTLLSRITGFGRIAALAYAIGQNALSDAYNVANTTPNIVYELVLGGVLSATLLPVFVRTLKVADAGGEDGDAAWRDLSAIVTIVCAVAAVLTLVFLLFAPLLVDLYLGTGSPGQRVVATDLLRLFVPQVLFYGAVTVTTAVLQARRRFAAPAFAPVANNLIVIGVLLALPHVTRDLDPAHFATHRTGLLLLGLGTTAGVAAMAIAQASRLPAAGIRLRPVWAPRSPGVRTVLGLSFWTLGFVLSNQVALLLVYRLAVADAGAQTAYTSALVFFLLPHGVWAVSVIGALSPDLAERWADKDVPGFVERLQVGARSVLAIVVPAAVGLAVLARPLLRATLQHGAMTATDAHLTADVLRALAVGLPGFSLFQLLSNTYQAMQDTRTLFWLYLIENGVNIALALVLHAAFGVVGLGAAYAAAYAVATVVSAAWLGRKLGAGWWRGQGRFALGVVAAAAVMGVVVFATSAAIGTVGDTTVVAVARLAVGTAAGGLAYLMLAARLGVREPLAVVQPLLRRIPGRRR